METPIPGHSARERLQERPSTAQTTRSSHVNRLCIVQIAIAVDEWTVAGRVDSGMPVKECSELIAARAVELLLSRPNG
eukprot:scaffold20767_cov108-Skeletonema_menzelii.AAC.1